MTKEEYASTSAAEHFRTLVANLNAMTETFNERFTALQLLAIHKANMLSEWDFLPDQWTQRQLREAISSGTVPQWDSDEKPIYAKPRAHRSNAGTRMTKTAAKRLQKG